MHKKYWRPFRIGAKATILVLLYGASTVSAHAQHELPKQPAVSTDLLAGGKESWTSPDWNRWEFQTGTLIGETVKFPEIATSDPDAAAYLLTKSVFGGDLELSMEIIFERSRYLGVYLDYDPETDTGMWLATGHPIPENAAGTEVEMAYIKTVDDGDWIVRARGELNIEPGEILRLRWVKSGPDYSIWQDDRMIATYRPDRRYDAGPVMLRLMSAVAEIQRLEMRSDEVR